MWQVPVVPARCCCSPRSWSPASRSRGRRRAAPFPPSGAIAFAAAAWSGRRGDRDPTGGESLVRQSQAEAAAGDIDAALADSAIGAEREAGAAAPRLQQALLLESAGELPAAAGAAAATEREMTNWRLWLVRSRIEAQRGNADAAIAYYGKARAPEPDLVGVLPVPP